MDRTGVPGGLGRTEKGGDLKGIVDQAKKDLGTPAPGKRVTDAAKKVLSPSESVIAGDETILPSGGKKETDPSKLVSFGGLKNSKISEIAKGAQKT